MAQVGCILEAEVRRMADEYWVRGTEEGTDPRKMP